MTDMEKRAHDLTVLLLGEAADSKGVKLINEKSTCNDEGVSAIVQDYCAMHNRVLTNLECYFSK